MHLPPADLRPAKPSSTPPACPPAPLPQSHEGGIGGEPWNEAHGGYTFCGLAAAALLGQAHRLDLDRLLRWAVRCQVRSASTSLFGCAAGPATLGGALGGCAAQACCAGRCQVRCSARRSTRHLGRMGGGGGLVAQQAQQAPYRRSIAVPPALIKT